MATIILVLLLNKYAFKAINTKKPYVVYSSNKLLRVDSSVIGLKTGYTSGAGACLIARAKKGKKDGLMIMLNAQNRWPNAKKA